MLDSRPVRWLSLALCLSVLSLIGSARAADSSNAFHGGVLWDTATIAPEVKSVEFFWVHPHSGAVFAFCNKGEVYTSSDDGGTWTQLTEKSDLRPTGLIEQVILDPKDDQCMYATSMYGGGAPFCTTDGGKTWRPLGPGHVDVGGVDFSDPERKLVIASKHEGHNGFIVSHNAGAKSEGKATWDKIDLKENTAFGAFVHIVDTKTWLLGCGGAWGGGMDGIFRTTDGGQTFQRLSGVPGPTYHCDFQEHDGKLYFVAGQGVAESSDQGQTWTLHETPQQPWSLAFGPSDTPWLSTVQGLFASRDGMKTWQPVSSSLKISTAHFTVSPKTGTMWASSLGEKGLHVRGRWQEKPADLIVWSGDRAAGQTWAKMGPKGSITVEPKAGVDGAAGLVLKFDGDGWRGGGLNWKGWYPDDACDDASRYTALVFQIRQTSKFENADLTVSLSDNIKRKDNEAAGNSVNVVGDGGLEQIDGQWRRVVLPLNLFTHGKGLQLSRLWQIDFSNFGNQALVFDIDHIGFALEEVKPPRFKDAPQFSASGKLSADAPLHSINDGIFGVCSLPREQLQEFRIPITRWGGNPSSRYNWELGIDNAGSDWYFKNRGTLLTRLSDSGYVKNIDSNQVIGATTYQTIPMVGWVAKDNTSYGFSVAKYGPQKATEPGQPDVGNGLRADGSKITDNDPRDTSVPAPPEFIGKAVRYVVKFAGKADGSDGQPGVKYWVLDNEPMLWHATHRDVHPEPLSYDELWQRTVTYGEAIKKGDPTAKVAGFCSWGWTDLSYSAKDAGNDSYRTKSDWVAHGKVPLCEWFIKKCAEYKKEHGKSLVDVLDVHWYPQGGAHGQGAYMGKGLNGELNAYRMRSTRDLWDRNYQQESWIKGTDNYSPVALLPRIRELVEKYNPGMEICLGEYNFGGADNVTGGLAQADVFGILAQQNIDLAFIWYAPAGSQASAWQLFRNYDGRGGAFGDQLLSCDSANPDVALYAARRKTDNAVTIVAINKNLGGPCALSLDLGALKGKLRVWQFDQDTNEKVQEAEELSRDAAGTLSLTLPPASANMLVITPTK